MDICDDIKLLDKMSILFNMDIKDCILIDFSSWKVNYPENEWFYGYILSFGEGEDYSIPYNFVAFCEISEQNEKNFIVKRIPVGKYAKFTIIGDVQKSVAQAWSEIWNMDLKRKYSFDFEECQNSVGNMENQEIHIYISLQD